MVATIDPGEVPTIPEEDFEMHEYDPPPPRTVALLCLMNLS